FYDYEIKPVYLRRSPVPRFDASFRSLCSERYALALEVSRARTPEDARRITRRLSRLDADIDAAVYVAFGLTAEERALVESEHARWMAQGSATDDEDVLA